MSFSPINTSNQNPNTENSLTEIFKSMLLARELPHNISEFFTGASDATDYSPGEISLVLSTCPPPDAYGNKPLYLKIINDDSKVSRVTTSSQPFKCPQHILVRTDLVVSSGTDPISILDVIQVNSDVIDPSVSYPRFRFIRSKTVPASHQMFSTPLASIDNFAKKGSVAIEAVTRDVSDLKSHFIDTNEHVQRVASSVRTTVTSVQESIQTAITKMLEMARSTAAGAATILSVTGAAAGLLYLADTWYSDFQLRISNEPDLDKVAYLKAKATNIIKTLLKCGAAALVAGMFLASLSSTIRERISAVAAAITKFGTDFMARSYDHVVGLGNRFSDFIMPSEVMSSFKLRRAQTIDNSSTYSLDFSNMRSSDKACHENAEYLQRYIVNCQRIIKSLKDDGSEPHILRGTEVKLSESPIGEIISSYFSNGGTLARSGIRDVDCEFIIRRSLNPDLVETGNSTSAEIMFLNANFTPTNNTGSVYVPYVQFLLSLRRMTLAVTDPSLIKPSLVEYMGLTLKELNTFYDVGLSPLKDVKYFPCFDFEPQESDYDSDGESSDDGFFSSTNTWDYQNWGRTPGTDAWARRLRDPISPKTKETRPLSSAEIKALHQVDEDEAWTLPVSSEDNASGEDDDVATPMMATAMPSAPATHQMGKDHGLSSFLALSYALFQYYANPRISISEHLTKLKSNSMALGVGMTAASFMTKIIPAQLRYAAFNKLGFGAPATLNPKQKALISNAFMICAHIRIPANRTIPNKREFDLIHNHLCTTIAKQSSTWSPSVRSFFNTAKEDMRRCANIADSIVDVNPIKPVPVGVWLWGKAGSGKTSMVSNIAKHLYDHVLPSMRLWTHNDANPYWDGYNGQKIVMFDDIGTDPTATAQNATFANLLTHMSSAPSAVAGADVSTKHTKFESEIVVLTSNVSPTALLQQISNQGRLTNPSAITRRFNNSTGLTVEIVIDEAYLIRGADGKPIGNSVAIAAAAARDPMQTPWCSYRFSDGSVTDFKGFFERIVVQLTRAKMVYRNMCAQLNDATPIDFASVRGLKAINAIVDVPMDMQFVRSDPADLQCMRRSAMSHRRRRARLALVEAFEGQLRDWDITQNKSARAGAEVLPISTFSHNVRLKLNDTYKGRQLEDRIVALQAALTKRANRLEALMDSKSLSTPVEDAKADSVGVVVANDAAVLNLAELTGAVDKHFDDLIAEGRFSVSVINEYREEYLSGFITSPVPLDDAVKTAILEEIVRRNVDEDNPVSIFSYCYTSFKEAAVKNWNEVETFYEQAVATRTKIDWISAAKILAGVVAAAGFVFAAWRIFSADTTVFQSKDPGKEEKLDPNANSKFTNRQNRSFHSGRSHPAANQMSSSHYVPASNLEAIGRLRKNTLKFSPHPFFDPKHYGSALFVRGRTVLMQAHYVQGLSPDNPIESTICCDGHTYHTIVRHEDIVALSEHGHRGDMILWDIPVDAGYKAPGPRKNIINLFTTAQSVDAHSGVYATNYDVDDFSKKHKVINRLNNDDTVEVIEHCRITSTPVRLTSWLGGGETERVLALQYARNCKAGDCGSVTIYNGKVIGIHTAGYGSKSTNDGIESRAMCVSNVVTKDILEALICSQHQGVEREQGCFLKCFSPEIDDGVLHPNRTFGKIPSTAEALGNVRVRTGPRTTKLVETRMMKVGSPMAAKCAVVPTQLSHEDMPPEMNLKSYADFLVHIHARKNTNACHLLNPELLEQCFYRLVGRVVPLPETKDPTRIWSLFEALNPNKGNYPLSHLSLSTSAGYGSVGQGKNSYIYFDEEKECYLPYPRLEALIENQLSKISNYVLPFQPFVVSPKDECRKVEKLTRLIDITTIDLTILARMGFWQFMTAWHKDPIAYGHVVGLSVNQGYDWTHMISHLNEMSPVGFGGDIKSFDGLFSQQAWVVLSKCIERWYKEHRLWTVEGAKIRAAIILNICHSCHVAGDRVYRFNEHMPSGSPLTTIANTLWSAVLLMYSYASMAPDRDVKNSSIVETRNGTLYNYENFVRGSACGDDNITAVSEVIGDWYNARGVAEFLETIGVTYTSPKKNEPHPEENQPITGIEFLSCVSVPCEVPTVVYSPRFNDKCLTKSFRWVRESNVKCEAEAVADNLNMVLQRAFWSGKARMDEIRADVVYHFAKAYPFYKNPRPFDSYEDTMLELGLGKPVECEPASLQMMATAVPSATSINDMTPVTMTASGGNATTKDYITRTPQNMVTLCRRTHPLHVFSETNSYSKVYDVAALFGCWWVASGEYTDLNYTAIHKISTFFRCWGGCPNFVVHMQEGAADIAFKPLNHEGGEASFYDAKNGTAAAANTATCYPTAVGERDCWGVSGVITQQTRFTCFKIKHFSSDKIEECSPGSIHMNAHGNPSGAFSYNFGDGTDVAVPFAIPLVFVGKNTTPDQYSALNSPAVHQMKQPDISSEGLYFDEYSGTWCEPADLQGVSFSNTNIKAVQSEGITTSTRNDFEQEVDTAVHGNDAPNQFVSLGAVLKQPAQYIASGVRFDTNPALAITPGLVPADMRTVSSSSDTSIMSVAKTTTAVVIELKTSFPQGHVLWDAPITPTRSIMSLTAPGQMVQPTALGAVSAMYAFWRGSLKLSIQAVMSGVHTCRLGVAILFGKFSVPTGGITQLTSQRFYAFELSAENRTGTVEIPFVSKTPLLETWRGQVAANPNTYATGQVVVFVLNELRGPEAASSSIDLVISEGPGHDFELLSPLTVNQSLRYLHEDGKRSEMIFSDPEDVAVFQMMESDDANVAAPEQKGVAYVDSSQIVESGVQSGTTTTTDAGGYIAMPQFSAINMLEREQLLHTGTWNTTDPVYTPIFEASVPNELFIFVAEKARNMFQYYNMVTHISIKVQATAFHSGRLAAFHVPMTNKSDFDRIFLGVGSAYPGIERRTNQTYTDHVFLDVSTSASSELIMPFRYFQPYLEEYEEQARFCLSVFTPLRVGTGGSTSVPISITVRFTDANMKVLNPY